ncbi:MAG: zinc ribbon domain-containing protein [Lachnospiraceae bacterium]|nr:zinc ribbon domain-containing protein [Lachnospiraceae bacterium]
MAFFDKLGETLSSKGRDVAKKAKELAEVTSLNGQINAKEELIRHTYEEIGKAYYEANKNDENAMYVKQCEQVAALRHEINKLHRQIQAIKGIQVCMTCGSEIPAGSAFCPGCGAPIASAKPEESEEESDSKTTLDTDKQQNVSEEEEDLAKESVSEEDVQKENAVPAGSVVSEEDPSTESVESLSIESEENPSIGSEEEASTNSEKKDTEE